MLSIQIVSIFKHFSILDYFQYFNINDAANNSKLI